MTQTNKTQIIDYWNKRATTFSEDKQAELESDHATSWLTEISRYITIRPNMRILDIGTGAGFLAILCAQQGATVNGIDISPEMVHSAQQNAARFQQTIDFQIMDAESLNFDNQTFDVVIARNVTWLLPHPKAAYQEWLRVLKQDGILINIDANYGQDSFTSYQDFTNDHAHAKLGDDMLTESETIKQNLTINKQPRPTYDFQLLLELGYEDITADTSVHGRVYQHQDAFYNPAPVFMLSVRK